MKLWFVDKEVQCHCYVTNCISKEYITLEPINSKNGAKSWSPQQLFISVQGPWVPGAQEPQRPCVLDRGDAPFGWIPDH